MRRRRAQYTPQYIYRKIEICQQVLGYPRLVEEIFRQLSKSEADSILDAVINSDDELYYAYAEAFPDYGDEY